jgi:hypothetical protein
MNVVHHFFIQNQQDLNLLNQAFIMLVPKKNHPHRVSDFRPISLTHSFFFQDYLKDFGYQVRTRTRAPSIL